MIKLCKLAMMLFAWGCLQTHTAFACRYNVRETGFVDFGIESYYLCVYFSENAPAETISSFKKISKEALANSSIRIEIINTDKQKDQPVLKYLDLLQIKSLPAAVLVSPEEQLLAVPVIKPDQSLEQALQSALEEILYSPKREEMLQQVSKNYGVVLLIEGGDGQENNKARQAALAAIEEIHRQMKFMPREIAHPPVLVSIKRESFSREKVLLWSLGLDADKIRQPNAAVLYGRARWIGPLLKGAEITEPVLYNILSVIGADCECGLDQRLLRGTILPIKWDEKMQAQAAKDLGFDPENPMVKIEVSRIMRMGSSSYPGIPFGRQGLTSELKSRQNQSTRAKDYEPPVPFVVDPVRPESVVAISEPVLRKPLYFIAGLVVLVAAAGLFIVLRATRRIS